MTRAMLLVPQGAPLPCPDCGAQGFALPVVDDPPAQVSLGRDWFELGCRRCNARFEAKLDHAEDPADWVWRISRTGDE